MPKQSDKKNNKIGKSTTTLLYDVHPQAIYTSRLLDFNNLPVPKNADDNTKKINASKPEKTSHKTIKELEPGYLVSFKSLGSNTKTGTFVKYNNKSKTLCTIFYDGEDKPIKVSNILTFKAIKSESM